MAFPANLDKHRRALLELLVEVLGDPARGATLRTRGISMEPLLRERDEVVLRAVRPEALRVGDLVAYASGGVVLVHRVVGVVGRDGRATIYEKGDNNLYLSPVEAGQVLGVVVGAVVGGRRLDLDAPRFRRLGRWVAGYGILAVKTYDRARRLGRRLGRPGTATVRLGRRAVRAMLQAPPRLVLLLARHLL